MEPAMRLWMYEQWTEDQVSEQENLKHHGLLIGSFSNPKAVKDIYDREKNTHAADDVEFDKFSRELFEKNRKEDAKKNSPKRRRQKKISAT
jgi:hypothetical protein